MNLANLSRLAGCLLIAVAASLGSVAMANDPRELTAHEAIDFSPGRPFLSVTERCSSRRHFDPTPQEVVNCSTRLRPAFERAMNARIDAEIDRVENLDRDLLTFQRERVGDVPDIGLTDPADKARALARYRAGVEPFVAQVTHGLAELVADAMGRDRYSRELHVLQNVHCRNRSLFEIVLPGKLPHACTTGTALIRRKACTLARNAIPESASLLLPSRATPESLGTIACRAAMDGYTLALEEGGSIKREVQLVVTSEVHGDTVATLGLERDARDGSLKPAGSQGRFMGTTTVLECLAASEHVPGLPPVSSECRTWKSVHHSAVAVARAKAGASH